MSGSLARTRYELRLKFKFWVCFQVAIPILGTFLVWPFHTLVARPFGFERTFGTAELLLLGAILLFGAAIDILYHEKTEPRLRFATQLDNYHILNFLFGVLFLIFYIFIKSYVTLLDFPSGIVAKDMTKLRFCAWASLSGAIAAAAWSALTTHMASKIILDHMAPRTAK